MKLSVKGLALAGGILWGVLGILGVGLINLIRPGYGQAFLELAASIYPGYHATASFGQVIVGTLYGFVDGAAGGALLAWLYNCFAGVKA
jgi:hypothetical protein